MYAIKYIIVNDSAAKGSACKSRHRFIPHLGYCCFVSSPDIGTLCKLRRHWPEAPILGESELDTSSTRVSVRVSAAMNAFRREMSDLP